MKKTAIIIGVLVLTVAGIFVLWHVSHGQTVARRGSDPEFHLKHQRGE